MKEELEKICVWHTISKDKIMKELRENFGLRNNRNYQKTDCSRCNGYDITCHHYMFIGDVVK